MCTAKQAFKDEVGTSLRESDKATTMTNKDVQVSWNAHL